MKNEEKNSRSRKNVKSKKFPESIEVGAGKFARTYRKLPNHFYIAFKEDAADKYIKELTKEKKLKIIKESFHRKRRYRRKRKLKEIWVKINEIDLALIAKKDIISRFAPVYVPFNEKKKLLSLAAAPLPDVIVVKTRKKPSNDFLRILKDEYNLEEVPSMSKNLGAFSYFVINKEGRSKFTAYEILDKVSQLDEVDLAEYDWVSMEPDVFIPNDTHWANQWDMVQIQVGGAGTTGWNTQTGDPNVVIAVLDSGCDLGHPDLTYTPTADHYNGQEAALGDPPPYDAGPVRAHGTSVAGIAAAILGNAQGVAGVAGGCTVLPAYHGDTSIREAASIDWAVAHGANVINMSSRFAPTNALQTAVQNADAAGVILVAAAGNDNMNGVEFPAAYPEVIAVGASDQNDERKRPASPDGECGWGSNWGPELEVMAPGVLIWTTDETGADGYNQNGNPLTRTSADPGWACLGPGGTYTYPTTGDTAGNYNSRFNGTSAATPHVAGLAALLISEYPTLTSQQIREIICMTCDKTSPGTYAYADDANHPLGTWHQEMGYGRINAARALCEGHWIALGVPPVELPNLNLNFNDIPEGVTTGRAIVFSINSCREFTFDITAGPTVTSGPPGTNFTALEITVTIDAVNTSPMPREARLWITYTGTNDGDVASGTVDVRCRETGEEWAVQISANTVSKPKIASVLALDKSGSMAWASGIPGKIRMDVLKYSAPIFVQHLDEEDGIGIVSFDEDAYTGMSVQTAGPHFGLVRANAISTIASLVPGTSTAIGDAVETSHNLLDPVTGFDSKAIVVFTDGHETAEKYISEVQHLINERVYAIGLGTAQVVQPTALNTLANGTGGYLIMTDELGTNDYLRLSKYFLQILAGVTNAEIVVDPEGYLIPGQEVRIPFRLTETDYRCDVILITLAPYAFKFFLETPDGDTIDPSIASSDPNISFLMHNNEAFYRMNIPLSGTGAHEGTWHAVLVIEESYYKRYFEKINKTSELYQTLIAHGIRYNLNVHARSNLKMKANLYQTSYEPGADLTIRAILTEYGIPLANRAFVRAEVERPDHTKTVLNLNEKEPGVFESKFGTVMSGIYKFQVKSMGQTLRGKPFTREQYLTGAVWKGGDDPPPTKKDDLKTWICNVLTCILNEGSISKELEEKLLKLGVNLARIRKCIEQNCADQTTEPERDFFEKYSKLKSMLKPNEIELLNQLLDEANHNKCC